MKFNLCLSNIPPEDRGSEALFPVLDYVKRCLSLLGHQVKVTMDYFDSSAINLLFENFTPEQSFQIEKIENQRGLLSE
jgi:hypothetical protein